MVLTYFLSSIITEILRKKMFTQKIKSQNVFSKHLADFQLAKYKQIPSESIPFKRIPLNPCQHLLQNQHKICQKAVFISSRINTFPTTSKTTEYSPTKQMNNSLQRTKKSRSCCLFLKLNLFPHTTSQNRCYSCWKSVQFTVYTIIGTSKKCFNSTELKMTEGKRV